MSHSQKMQVLSTVIEGAKLYNKYLNNKKILIFYVNKCHVESIEICFKPEHFLHLTAIDSHCRAKLFFNKCIDSKLSLQDFNLRSDGTTVQKAQVLLSAAQMPFTAKMIGPFASTGISLNSDKLFGSIGYSMGAICRNGEFVPNTLLKKDIRDIVNPCHKIIALFVKNINDTLYNQYTLFPTQNCDVNCFQNHPLVNTDLTSWVHICK